MNTTYLNHVFLHHLLSLIIHREENCQISIHSIPSTALQPLLGPCLPQQTSPYFSVVCLSHCRILLRSFQQPAVPFYSLQSVINIFFIIMLSDSTYVLLELVGPWQDYRLLTTILVSNEDLWFRRWFFFIDPLQRRSVALHSTASPSVEKARNYCSCPILPQLNRWGKHVQMRSILMCTNRKFSAA